MAALDEPEPCYTVFIRLPFPRGDFVDPPAVCWDAVKDKSLWKILSKASKNSDIDWTALAEKFDVSLPFLLQQAAWLYERQLSQVRAQMRKVGASKSSAQSPIPGADSTGGETMRRTGSGGGGPQVPSSMSNRKDSPVPRNDGNISNIPSRATAPPLSRKSSANTVQGRPFLQTSPRPAKATLHRLSISPPSNVRPSPLLVAPLSILSKTKTHSPSEAAESSSSDSSSNSDLAQSRLLRRPRRFPSHKLGRSEDADDDDDAPAFLPFSTPAGPSTTQQDSSATLKEDPGQLTRRNTPKKSTEVIQQSQTSDSSTNSTVPTTKPTEKGPNHPQRPTGPLSPRRAPELAGRSPVGRGKGLGREGSDGTPSMGSSFSDLDDASVTQSALEEALASNMQKGGMASRMSTISQALRSRYL